MDNNAILAEEEIIRLITGTAADREKGAACLHNKYHKELIPIGIALHKLRSDEIETAYDDAIISVVDNVATGKFEHRSNLKTYLNRIFNNKCVDQIRLNTTNKEKPNNQYWDIDGLDDLLADNPEMQEMFERQMAAVNQAWPKLKLQCQQLLKLNSIGKSDQEILDTIGGYASADSVKVTRLRCLAALRKLCNV